jgi:hypothetical protein
MLDDERDRGTENGGGDHHRGDFELERCDEGQKVNLERPYLEIRGDDVNHPRGYDRARYELGIFEKRRQSRASSFRSCTVRQPLSNLPLPARISAPSTIQSGDYRLPGAM